MTEGSDEIKEVSLVSVISNSVGAVIFQFQPWLVLKENKQKLYISSSQVTRPLNTYMSKSKYSEHIWIIYRDSCYSEGLAIEAICEAEAGGEEGDKGND